MKLSKRARTALEKSHKHWQENVTNLELMADNIKCKPVTEILSSKITIWIKGKLYIASHSANYCDLCELYYDNKCKYCPIKLFYSMDCTKNNSPYNNYIHEFYKTKMTKKSLTALSKSAQDMADYLYKILQETD